MQNLLEAIRVSLTSDTGMNLATLTDALSADLAVTFGALTGEGTDRVDALLAGLTVMLVSLAFVHVCVGGEMGTRRCENEASQATLSVIGLNRKMQCECQ